MTLLWVSKYKGDFVYICDKVYPNGFRFQKGTSFTLQKWPLVLETSST